MKCRDFKGYYIKLNKGADSDVINRLESMHNKQGYIKHLIRNDIAFEHFMQTAEAQAELERIKDNVKEVFGDGDKQKGEV